MEATHCFKSKQSTLYWRTLMNYHFASCAPSTVDSLQIKLSACYRPYVHYAKIRFPRTSLIVFLFLLLAKEIYSLFASGNIYYEGQVYLTYDEDIDLCIGPNTLCPLRQCGEFILKLYKEDLRSFLQVLVLCKGNLISLNIKTVIDGLVHAKLNSIISKLCLN